MYQYCQLMMLHFIFVTELLAGFIEIQLLRIDYHHVLAVHTTFTVKKLNNCFNLKSDVILLKNTVD